LNLILILILFLVLVLALALALTTVRRVKRVPRTLAAISLGACSAPMTTTDAGTDAGYDAGTEPDAGSPKGTPWGDAGCVLPSDFPWDSGNANALADSACQCVWVPVLHCFTEDGPRCFSWACPPGKSADGGYQTFPDGGIVCLC
jgi:hypothetical protein